MSSDSFKRRKKAAPLADKCKQCQVEKAIPGRADQLGRNCAHYADDAVARMAKKKPA
jgi:hypothetical protein